MKIVTCNDDLIIGKKYICKNKQGKNKQLLECKYDGSFKWKYLGSSIWADERNNQALSLWDIAGPFELPWPSGC